MDNIGRYAIAKHVKIAPADSGVIILDTKKGVYWQLNATGAIVIRGIENGRDLVEIVNEICTGTDVSQDRASTDVSQMIVELIKSGFVTGGQG